jgi:hypothetical protein
MAAAFSPETHTQDFDTEIRPAHWRSANSNAHQGHVLQVGLSQSIPLFFLQRHVT